EDDQALGVGLPVLPLLGIGAQQAVQPTLGSGEHRREEHALAGVHLGHIAAERQRESGEDHREQDDREPAGDGHRSSPRISAYSRYTITSSDTTRPTASPTVMCHTRYAGTSVICGRCPRSARAGSRTSRSRSLSRGCPCPYVHYWARAVTAP